MSNMVLNITNGRSTRLRPFGFLLLALLEAGLQEGICAAEGNGKIDHPENGAMPKQGIYTDGQHGDHRKRKKYGDAIAGNPEPGMEPSDLQTAHKAPSHQRCQSQHKDGGGHECLGRQQVALRVFNINHEKHVQLKDIGECQATKQC